MKTIIKGLVVKKLGELGYEFGGYVFIICVVILFVFGFVEIIIHKTPLIESTPVYSEITKIGACPVYRDTINNICFVKVKLGDESHISSVDCDKILQKSTKPIQLPVSVKK